MSAVISNAVLTGDLYDIDKIIQETCGDASRGVVKCSCRGMLSIVVPPSAGWPTPGESAVD